MRDDIEAIAAAAAAFALGFVLLRHMPRMTMPALIEEAIPVAIMVIFGFIAVAVFLGVRDILRMRRP